MNIRIRTLVFSLIICMLLPLFWGHASCKATEATFTPSQNGSYVGITDAIENTIVDLSHVQYVLESRILPKDGKDRFVRVDTTDLNNDTPRSPAVIGKADCSFNEHLSLHPNNQESYVILDVSNLDCDRFYSAVGISAATGKANNKGVVFTVYGYSEAKEMFELLATSGDLYGYESGEFHVDIRGYSIIKLSVSLTADAKDYNSRTASWCNVSAYKSTQGDVPKEDTSIQIPEFTSSGVTALAPHYCGNDNFELVYESLGNSILADIAAYETRLQQAGYSLYARNNIGQNQFFTYVNDNTLIHCTYFHSTQVFRIVYGPRTYTGPQSPVTDHKKVVTPSVSIMGMTDSELCMVFQLEDGSFIIIDGGNGTDRNETVILNEGTEHEYAFEVHRSVETNLATIWNFLKNNTPEGQRPQVTWMITHADGDHIALPQLFIEKHSNEFDLNTVVYNFPNFNNIGLSSTLNPDNFTRSVDQFLSAVQTHFPNANHYIYHTGMKLYLPGCEIEFLYSHEDFWPAKMTSCNHTSGIWRLTIADKTILVTGDCEADPNRTVASHFGNYLKSDVLQVVHHGSNGGTYSFYRQIAPSVCLWPCTQQHFEYDLRRTGQLAGWTFNKYLRETAKAHYSCGATTTLRLPSLEVRPEPSSPDYMETQPSVPSDFDTQPSGTTSVTESTATEPAPAGSLNSVVYAVVIGVFVLCVIIFTIILLCKRNAAKQK